MGKVLQYRIRFTKDKCAIANDIDQYRHLAIGI